MRFKGKATIGVATFLFFLSVVPHAGAQDREPASDRELHILAGIVASVGSASLLLSVCQAGEADRAAIIAAAGAAALCAGIGKELIDSLGFGTPDFRDLLNTGLGGLVGISAVAFAFSAFPSNNSGVQKDLPPTFFSLSLILSVPVLQHFLTTAVDFGESLP